MICIKIILRLEILLLYINIENNVINIVIIDNKIL